MKEGNVKNIVEGTPKGKPFKDMTRKEQDAVVRKALEQGDLTVIETTEITRSVAVFNQMYQNETMLRRICQDYEYEIEVTQRAMERLGLERKKFTEMFKSIMAEDKAAYQAEEERQMIVGQPPKTAEPRQPKPGSILGLDGKEMK